MDKIADEHAPELFDLFSDSPRLFRIWAHVVENEFPVFDIIVDAFQ